MEIQAVTNLINVLMMHGKEVHLMENARCLFNQLEKLALFILKRRLQDYGQVQQILLPFPRKLFLQLILIKLMN